MVGITAITSVLPENFTKTHDLPGYTSLSDKEQLYFDNAGIETVGIFHEITARDLALQAAQKLFKENNIDAKNIDAIIMLQPRTSDYLISSDLMYLQSQLGIETAFSFTLSDLGCVASSSALMLAKFLLESNNKFNKVLITYGSKPFSTNNRFRYPVTVIGDGGIAVLVSKTNNKISIIDGELETNGKYWDLFYIDYKNIPSEHWKARVRNMYEYSFELAVESKNRFQSINQKLLHRNNCTHLDIQHHIMQNISISGFQFYQESFNIVFSDNCKENLTKYGHLGPMDILLNLQSGLDTGIFRENDKILLMNNSPVAAWESLLLRV